MATPKKVSELSAITNLSGDDLLLVVNDPNGTATSRKVTHKNFFANVVSDTTHRGRTTFQANTFVYGNQMTVQANANFTQASFTVNSRVVLDDIDDRLQIANAASTYVSKAEFAANNVTSNNYVHSSFTTNTVFQAYVANTNSQWTTLYSEGALASNTYLQSLLANTNAFISSKADQSTVDASNTALNELIDARIEVANVVGVYATSSDFNSFVANTNQYIAEKSPISDPNFIGTVDVFDLEANTVSIASNTGLVLAGGGLGNQPSTANATNEGYAPGTIWYSNNYLYIAVDLNTIKRVSLDTF